MMLHVRAVAAGALATFALALTACTASSAPPAQVPTLSATGSASQPGTGGASSTVDAGRPRQRIDMTNEEIAALWSPYNQCLAANGYTKSDSSNQAAQQAALPKAQMACQSKHPLPPWQLDANNPHGEDFVHAIVQCLRAKGVKYVSEEPSQGGAYMFGFGGPNNDSDSITKGLADTPACEKQVTAQGIGN